MKSSQKNFSSIKHETTQRKGETESIVTITFNQTHTGSRNEVQVEFTCRNCKKKINQNFSAVTALFIDDLPCSFCSNETPVYAKWSDDSNELLIKGITPEIKIIE
jgi:hypothetical protein